MVSTVPIVNYLRLDESGARLVSTDCDACNARFLGTRIACARCGARAFSENPLADEGTVGSFTIIHRAPKGVPVPYVSALVDLKDGFTIKTNIIECAPDPETVTLGMHVRLATYELGTDDNGTTAVGFGFAPTSEESK